MIKIVEANNRKLQKEFIKFPFKIYANDPYWVAPLNQDMWAFAKKKDAFFESGDLQWFLAYKDDEIVGRIGTSYSKLYNDHHNENTGFFGFFECINDQAVANALFEKAFEVITQQGFDKIMGPCSPSPNHDFGLLIDGFDDPPRIMSTYNPRYYRDLYEGFGLKNPHLLYAYKMDRYTVEGNEKLMRGVDLVKKRYNITIRKMEKKHLSRDVALIQKIWNEAWAPKWGFIPFTDRAMEKLKEDFSLLVDTDFVLFAEIEGKTVGMILSLPDYNEKFIHFKGKLFPFNFLKLLFGKKDYKWIRVVLLGVLPEYQKKGIDALFFEQIIRTSIEKGMEFGDASWILAENEMMNRAMKLANAKVYKQWFVYDTPISAE